MGIGVSFTVWYGISCYSNTGKSIHRAMETTPLVEWFHWASVAVPGCFWRQWCQFITFSKRNTHTTNIYIYIEDIQKNVIIWVYIYIYVYCIYMQNLYMCVYIYYANYNNNHKQSQYMNLLYGEYVFLCCCYIIGFEAIPSQYFGKVWLLPSGKRSQKTYGKIHHVQWVNPLFLWSCSIAMLVITKGCKTLTLSYLYQDLIGQMLKNTVKSMIVLLQRCISFFTAYPLTVFSD